MGKYIGTGGLARGKILGRLAFYTWVLGTYTLLTKLTHGDNCHGWSPTNPMWRPQITNLWNPVRFRPRKEENLVS